MIYLDSSAVMKLVRQEEESAALSDWLAGYVEEPLVFSELGRVEVLRAARRVGTSVVAQARAVVDELDLVPLDRAVQDLAFDIGSPLLRPLDALHLASALTLGTELTTFVSYDHRLTDAARAAGLVVASPGQVPTPDEG